MMINKFNYKFNELSGLNMINPKKIATGLDILGQNPNLQALAKGRIGHLCHQASLTSELEESISVLKRIYGDRLTKLFSPQHGILSDVQDNMVETPHGTHPYYDLPVYSLYSETREPTNQMLEDLDTIIIDLQDVGTRVYTYITTVVSILKACAKKNIHVIILDRPNPAGGEFVEGNILNMDFESFVGVLPIPMRHGMTMAEFAKWATNHLNLDLELTCVKMEGWRRNMRWEETGLHWVNPSPNLPTASSAITFCGTVLFEGTNISEGRGTTRSLEQIGHPGIDAYNLMPKIKSLLARPHFENIQIRPTHFLPTFQKHKDTLCSGHFIHCHRPQANTWALGQMLMALYFEGLGEQFNWKTEKYEYKNDRPAIDYINGTDRIRKWIEESRKLEDLFSIEKEGREDFMVSRREVLLYN